MSATTKIAVHSLPDLKATTDDALPNYLHSLKFKQLHTQTDTRLALGYTAVLISGALFYYDWKFGWEASKPYTLPAVVAYFVLNTAFSYWLWFVEAGVVYEGESKTGKVRIATSTRKHVPVYEASVTYTEAGAGQKQQTVKVKAPFARWFTKDGYFVAKPFQQWLASAVPVIGAADPNNVVEEIGRGSGAEGLFNVAGGQNAAEILEQLNASGANVSAGGGSGRRRKA